MHPMRLQRARRNLRAREVVEDACKSLERAGITAVVEPVHELLHQLTVACQRLHRFFTAQRRLCPFHVRQRKPFHILLLQGLGCRI